MPAYIVAQLIGAVLATLLRWALIGKQSSAGLTPPGDGISTTTAMLWEPVLTAGLVSAILGNASRGMLGVSSGDPTESHASDNCRKRGLL